MKNTKTFSRGTVHRIQRNNTPINNLFYENDSVKNQNHAEFRYIKNVVIPIFYRPKNINESIFFNCAISQWEFSFWLKPYYFGRSKNIWNLSKYHDMDYKFHGMEIFEINKICLTPHSVSLRWVKLSAVLAKFGFADNSISNSAQC